MLRGRNLKPVQIVRQGEPVWGALSFDLTPVEVLGWIQPVPFRRHAGQGSGGLPVPSSVAYLPFSAPVDVPGFVLRCEGKTYYPVGDAEDVGGVGKYWRVPLGSPGQVSSGPA